MAECASRSPSAVLYPFSLEGVAYLIFHAVELSKIRMVECLFDGESLAGSKRRSLSIKSQAERRKRKKERERAEEKRRR